MNFNKRHFDKDLIIQGVLSGFIMGGALIVLTISLMNQSSGAFERSVLTAVLLTYAMIFKDANYYSTLINTFPMNRSDYLGLLLSRNFNKFLISIPISIVLIVVAQFKIHLDLKVMVFVICITIPTLFCSTRAYNMVRFSESKGVWFDNPLMYGTLLAVLGILPIDLIIQYATSDGAIIGYIVIYNIGIWLLDEETMKQYHNKLKEKEARYVPDHKGNTKTTEAL